MTLHDRLDAVPLEAGAEERAWRLVRAAHAERVPARRGVRPRRLALAVAALALVAAALVAPGIAVLGSLRHAIAPTTPAPTPGLPAPGRLLVEAPSGAWIVERDGAKRRLGAYRDPAWSPHGLFVAAVGGGQLVALDPRGNVRWALPHAKAIATPAWSSDGYRIAYRVGRTLHLVAGDGTGDRAIALRVAPVRPAWRPGPGHIVAWVTERGVVSVAEADTSRGLWSTRPGDPPTALAWSADGRLLLVTTSRGAELYGASGRRVRRIRGGGLRAAAFVGAGDDVAELRRGGDRSTILVGGRILFATPGRLSGLSPSPDGRWLAAGWPSAGRWLFLRLHPGRAVLSVGGVGRAFEPSGRGPADFPRLGDWCCVSARPPAG